MKEIRAAGQDFQNSAFFLFSQSVCDAALLCGKARQHFRFVWCCIENIFLAAAAERLACAMRIPVGEEGQKAADVVNAPKGYVLPCYIGIGYPADDGMVLEQIQRDIKDVLHFCKW